MLRTAFIGYRFMGTAHANAIARLPMFFPEAPEVERTVLVGRDEEALREANERLGFERVATDWREAIDDVDVLYNLGPNHIHAEPTIAALDADTHVLCEKPLAPTLAEADRMVEAARASDATAGVAFNYRYVPAIRYAKRLIESGELGEIYQIRGRYLQDWGLDPNEPRSWRYDSERAGAGTVLDVGAHTMDLARFLVGEQVGDVEWITGTRSTFIPERPAPNGDGTEPVTTDDAYAAVAEFEEGALGVFDASRTAAGRKAENAIEVYGSEGAIAFSLERLNELQVYREGTETRRGNRGFETVLVTGDEDPYMDRWWPPGHTIGYEHTFVHENYEFLSAVDAGEAYEPSFETGYEVQRILDGVVRAQEDRTWIEL